MTTLLRRPKWGTLLHTGETFKIGYHNNKCPKYISPSGKCFSPENPLINSREFENLSIRYIYTFLSVAPHDRSLLILFLFLIYCLKSDIFKTLCRCSLGHCPLSVVYLLLRGSLCWHRCSLHTIVFRLMKVLRISNCGWIRW